MDLIKNLKKQLNDIPNNYIVLIETSSDQSLELSTAVVKYLSAKHDKGIIVSVNRPYTNLVDIYKKNNIDVSKMFILDCISKNQNAVINAKNVTFLDGVSALTDISLSINEHMNGSKGGQFVFFDSITTMLIHNNPYIFTRFIHNVLTKMRLKGVGGLLISVKGNSNNEIRAEIAQLCDKVIKIP